MSPPPSRGPCWQHRLGPGLSVSLAHGVLPRPPPRPLAWEDTGFSHVSTAFRTLSLPDPRKDVSLTDLSLISLRTCTEASEP